MISKTSRLLGLTAIVAGGLVFFQAGCSSQADPPGDQQPEKKELTKTELTARGQYLTTVAGCNDCHTPKVFGPHGMSFDSTRLLSGHPANDPLPPIDPKALQPGNWMLMASGLTSAVGPWGISYAANLTPDSSTGIGAWDEATFIKTLRTGKHLGQENGRPILPPMPWPTIGLMTDEDLKSIYTFLHSLKPISNQVPAPVPPNEAAKPAK